MKYSAVLSSHFTINLNTTKITYLHPICRISRGHNSLRHNSWIVFVAHYSRRYPYTNKTDVQSSHLWRDIMPLGKALHFGWAGCLFLQDLSLSIPRKVDYLEPENKGNKLLQTINKYSTSQLTRHHITKVLNFHLYQSVWETRVLQNWYHQNVDAVFPIVSNLFCQLQAASYIWKQMFSHLQKLIYLEAWNFVSAIEIHHE
jgi:hypothetical protein